MSRLATVARDVLSSQPPEEAVDAIKEAACRTLSEADPRAQPKKTNHFNHTFLPDIVVSWPEEKKEVRHVFLRFDIASKTIAQDIHDLGGDGPILLGLTDSGPEEKDAISTAVRNELELRRRTLLARPDGLESVHPEPTSDLLTRLVLGSVVRAARGTLEIEDATRLLDSAQRGYRAATSLDSAALTAPMRDLEQSFVSEVSEDTAKTLHMLWWSAGGDPQEFPGGLDLSLDISESDIRQFLVYLFSQPPIGDPTLWQRLGTRVAAKTLLELHTLESSSNLSEFVVQNLNRLQFRCVAADRLEDRLPLDGPLAWELSQGHLVLRGRDFELAFALDGRHFNHRSGGSPLSPAEAVRRATGFSVDSIELDEERRLIGIRAKGVTDQGTTASLEELLQGETGSVTELTVRLQDGAPLRCVYERNAGFIDTDRNLPTLSLLAQGAVRLLLHLEPNDLANLLEYLRPRAVALGQGELGLEMPFDDRSD